MYRMSNPEHGFQMVQPSDKPMFDRAGWSVVVESPVVVAAELEPSEPGPEQPRKRGRPRKVTSDADSL